MKSSENSVPSLAELALKYGTINRDQLKDVHVFIQEKASLGETYQLGDVLILKKMATRYQINLMQIIRDFLVLKKKGEQFGQIAVQKGYATDEEVELALDRQQQLFRKSKVQKILGDLLVESGVITEKQRQIITEEQKKAEEISLEPPPTMENPMEGPTENPMENRKTRPSGHPGKSLEEPNDDIKFKEAEKEFLKIRALDTDFALKVLEKGFATLDSVEVAMAIQNECYEKFRKLHMLGDIMVSEGVLSEKQKNIILKQQKRLQAPAASNSRKRSEISEDHDATKNFNSLELFEDIEITISDSRMEAWIRILEPLRQDEAHIKPDQLSAKNDAASDMASGRNCTLMSLVSPLSSVSSISTTFSDPSNSSDSSNSGPPSESTADIKPCTTATPGRIRAILKQNGITRGICKDAVIQSFLDLNELFFPVAMGEHLYSTVPQYEFDIHQRGKKTPLKKNKTLASTNTRHIDIQIRDVMGKTVENLSANNKNPVLRCGKGVALSEDGTRALALQGGYPALSVDGRLYIFPVVNILGDADARFGAIDEYASINVSGILTGAYRVNAGNVKAREIRGCTLNAVGDVTTEMGIIGSTINIQGSVKARYIHNCRIEAFGDVKVEHEIIDSTLIISGACSVPQSRIIASSVSAKQGIKTAGVGSNVTEPCELKAGCEDHIVLQSLYITRQIRESENSLTKMLEKKEAAREQKEKIFNKMVDLKILHDRARTKSLRFHNELDKGTITEGTESYEKTVRLINALKEKMGSSISALRKYNKQKKELDRHLSRMESTIEIVSNRVKKKICSLEMDRNRFMQWTESQPADPEIVVLGRIVQGTKISGVFASTTLDDDFKNVKFTEKRKETKKNGSNEYHIENGSNKYRIQTDFLRLPEPMNKL